MENFACFLFTNDEVVKGQRMTKGENGSQTLKRFFSINLSRLYALNGGKARIV